MSNKRILHFAFSKVSPLTILPWPKEIATELTVENFTRRCAMRCNVLQWHLYLHCRNSQMLAYYQVYYSKKLPSWLLRIFPGAAQWASTRCNVFCLCTAEILKSQPTSQFTIAKSYRADCWEFFPGDAQWDATCCNVFCLGAGSAAGGEDVSKVSSTVTSWSKMCVFEKCLHSDCTADLCCVHRGTDVTYTHTVTDVTYTHRVNDDI